MPEPVSLELLGAQVERVLTELREVRLGLERVERKVGAIDADLGSLARVMLRLDSRVTALETAGK